MSTIKKLLDNKVFQIIYTIIKVVFFAFLAIYILFVMFQRITNNSDIFYNCPIKEKYKPKFKK